MGVNYVSAFFEYSEILHFNAAVVDRKITFWFLFRGHIYIFRVNGVYLGSVDTWNETVCSSFIQASGAGGNQTTLYFIDRPKRPKSS